MSLFRLIFSFVLALSASQAFAKAHLDNSVKGFIRGQHPESVNKTMQIVVMYELPKTTLASGSVEKQLRIQTAEAEKEVLKGMNIRATQELLWIVGGSVLTLTAEEAAALSVHPQVKAMTDANAPAQIIEATDGAKTVAKETYTYGLEKIGIPELRQTLPEITGKGVRVGIIDTGADPNHPDLKDKIAAFKDFSGSKMVEPDDDHGHGTHVAGTISGSATSSQSIGIAPAVKLIIAKAFNSGGGSSEKDLLAAMQWVADPDGDPSTQDFAQVVNNSWGAGGSFSNNTPDKDPFCIALANWNKIGMIAVFAAGNSGPSQSSIGLPAACPQSVSVGATDDRDNIASFSSRGPVKWKNTEIVKPEVSAPGEDIYSAQPGGGYTYKSGTSMACPHVVGAFALLLQAKAGISVVDAQAAMIGGTVDLGRSGKDTTFGSGRIYVPKSLELLK